MKKILQKIYNGQYLTQKESERLFKFIIVNKINEMQLSALLMTIKTRGETIDEIYGAVLSLFKNCKFFPRPKYIFSDIVGTGGCDFHTMNISTATAFVLAAAGFKIVKHCNYNISSKVGSANILKSLKIPLNITPNQSRFLLDNYNICFLLAPKYHSSFKLIHKIRANLNTRTIYNILGPLLNPAKPNYTIIGVYNYNLIDPMINLLKKLNYKHAIVVNSDNIDELTLHDITHVAELNNNVITKYSLTAKDFGLEPYSKDVLKSGTVTQNARILKNILQGTKKYIDLEHTVAANVALFLRNLGFLNLKENTKYALKIIYSGIAYKNLLSISKSCII
ncbi:anthranilate phosphoribosyltransferase [Buchnera aphidicola (Mollitrichosiphum nigrofasciatum)]|uniref:anthranilate phosphoribosyltransferase n=1 Tax=Buchnera aphidicola TaxID=9 RepID=UPI0031B8AD04